MKGPPQLLSSATTPIAAAAVAVDLRPQPVCAVDRCGQPGGGVLQREQAEGPAPAAFIANQKAGTPEVYRQQARRDGIAHRPHGLFPPGDALLTRLAVTPGFWPFEKHLPGAASPYETLPRGGWITGDAAAQRGVDLRLFYQVSEAPGQPGVVAGAVRFGDGAAIGVGFHLSAHGGACETVLDEATAELGKCEFQPFLSTREATFAIKRPVPLHTTLAVRCWITQRKGIRCWVEGRIESADGSVEYVTATAQLVDMTHFI